MGHPAVHRAASALCSGRLSLSLSLSLLSLLFITLLTIQPTSAQETCQFFQSLAAPVASPNLRLCRSAKYLSSSCCDSASAKRAYNWVKEDDGCGFIYGNCERILTDLACHVNCAPDVIVTGVNYNNSRQVLPDKVVISEDFAERLWDYCKGYNWCGSQQFMTTDCRYLAIIVEGDSSGHTSDAIAASNTIADTCTSVWDVTPKTFAENILGVVVHSPADGDLGDRINPVTVPKGSAPSAIMLSAWSIMAAIIMGVFSVTVTSRL